MATMDVSTTQAHSSAAGNATPGTPTAIGPDKRSPLAGRVKPEASGTPRALPLILLDYARAALRTIASMFPGAARFREKPASQPILQSEPDDADASAPLPAGPSHLSDQQIRAFSDQELHARAASLSNSGKRIHELRQFIPAEQGRGYQEDELHLIDMELRVRAEVARRGSVDIEKSVGRVIAQAVDLARKPDVGGDLGLKVKNAFLTADESLRKLEEKDGLNIGIDITEQGKRIMGGERRIAAASLFVAAELGRLNADDRQLLLGAMRPSDLKRLAQSDPTGGAASAATGAVITAAKRELARREDQLSQSFQSAAENFLARHPAGETIRLQDLSGFLNDLQEAGRQLGVLNTHRDGIGGNLSPEIKGLRDNVGARLREWLQSEPALGVLEAQEFGRVVGALEQFGAPPSPQLLKKEAAAQVAPLEARYQKATDLMVKGLVDQDPHLVLEGLKDMATSFTGVHDAHHRLLRDTNSPEDEAKLRLKFISNALSKLNDEQAHAVLETVSSTPFLAMIDGLGAASEEAQTHEHFEPAIQLSTMGRYVEEAAMEVEHDAVRRVQLNAGETAWLTPTQLPPPSQAPRWDKPVTAERMTDDYRRAFKNALGIEIQKNGKPRFQ
jgi:hypothetical protein